MNVDFGAYLYLLLARWLSVTSVHKDTHNNEQWSLANASHQPHGMQSLRLEGHIFLPFVFIPHLVKNSHARALSCLHCLDWKTSRRYTRSLVFKMKPNQQKEDEPNPAQKYLNQLIVVIEVLWTILILHPASVSKEQRFWGPQFIKSTITEVQFVPGSQELRAPLCSTN